MNKAEEFIEKKAMELLNEYLDLNNNPSWCGWYIDKAKKFIRSFIKELENRGK